MDTLKIRGTIILVLMGLIMSVYIGRLFSIQVLSKEYARKAGRTVIKTRPVIPPRGNIYDRYSEIYVSNSPMFNLLITPNELTIPDTSILEKYLNLDREEIRSRIRQARKQSSFKEFVFERYIEPELYGLLVEQLWNFRGISFSVVNKRHYNMPVGGNVLGYINEVNQMEIANSEGLYKLGDQIGRTGIERSYDKTLRGEQGLRKVLTNVYGREVGPYAEGRFDTEAEKGRDILLGIDTRLQALGEELMQGKNGSIVAIEPKSGEILAFISAPSYNPVTLTGKDFAENYKKLKRNAESPLFNRPLKAEYPPGSIFKIPLALASLNEGIISPETRYSCGGGFKRNRGKPGCRYHAALQLNSAIRVSCNSYFAATYFDFLHHKKYRDLYEAYDTWRSYMNDMGIGKKLELDIPFEEEGLIPTSERYDRMYGKGRWMGMTIISNSIGQGEIEMTPAQMAYMTSIVANRGYSRRPHFVRAVRRQAEKPFEQIYYPVERTRIELKHFETVIEAMERVVNGGTAGRAFIPDIRIAGKTGTVENSHGEDHAVFIGFAPVNDPQIAIAVVIENAGGGGSWAAPTASVMIEQAIRREVKYKKYELERVNRPDLRRNKPEKKWTEILI